MLDNSRRTVVKALVGIPVVGAAMKTFMFGWGSQVSKLDSAQDAPAIQVLRMINTAERQFFDSNGRFAEFGELWRDAHVKERINGEQAETAKQGRTLFASLRLDQSEIIPGWKLGLGLKPGRFGYLVSR